MSIPVNHSSSTNDSTDELVATERRRKQTKSKKGGTERRKKSVSTESGYSIHYMHGNLGPPVGSKNRWHYL